MQVANELHFYSVLIGGSILLSTRNDQACSLIDDWTLILYNKSSNSMHFCPRILHYFKNRTIWIYTMMLLVKKIFRFGVCCVFLYSSTSNTISYNDSYLQNPGFPSAFTSTGTTISYTITKCSNSMRLW